MKTNTYKTQKHLRLYFDKYNLYKRIKNINPGYSLFFNSKTKNFEIHDLSNCMCSLCLMVSPEDLHAGIIKKLFKTRKENMKQVFIEMENKNNMIEQNKRKKMIEKAGDAFKEIMGFSSRFSRDLSNGEIKNIINKLGE